MFANLCSSLESFSKKGQRETSLIRIPQDSSHFLSHEHFVVTIIPRQNNLFYKNSYKIRMPLISEEFESVIFYEYTYNILYIGTEIRIFILEKNVFRISIRFIYCMYVMHSYNYKIFIIFQIIICIYYPGLRIINYFLN